MEALFATYNIKELEHITDGANAGQSLMIPMLEFQDTLWQEVLCTA